MTSTTKCRLNSDGSVSLADIITSFHSSIREEHAWALCHQCAKFFVDNLRADHRTTSYLVTDMQHVYLQADGNLHPNTLYLQQRGDPRKPIANQLELINGLGCIIYNALDQGTNNGEERTISKDLEELINDMVVYEQSFHHETDDEGIERDSGDPDGDDSASRHPNHITLHKILERCEKHVGKLSKTEAESHYRAVVKALVAEALELATFLESVASGINTRNGDNSTNTDLEQLQFADWARFWVQVMSELRRGFNLKKVNYTKAPIEYELTPYEILMKDIRTCRYQLRKIIVNDDVPKVNKDARAIILDFIRSRPPLKKVSDRKLPPRQYTYTPREQLMHSIRKGRKLRKTKFPQSPTKARHLPTGGGGGDSANTTARRLIKIDLAQLDDDDDDSDDSSESWPTPELTRLEPYDLALETPLRAAPRRHSLSVCLEPNMGSQSVPQSRPCSRQSCASNDTLDGVSVQLPPEISKALEDNSKPWHENVSLEDRLALTLEEIVHIRIVLTKAELEALPVEGHVRGDVENRKVCFLCLKTRFGILGPWGHRCSLCKRTVCSKCYSKMNIPMEHYSSLPVVLLSPSNMCTPEEEYSKVLNNKNSANSSPQPSPCNSRPSSSLDRFRNKALTVTKPNVVDRLKGSQMLVCNDCKMMVLQIIKSGQANRSAIRNKHLQNLTLNLEPVFTVQ